MQLSVQWLRTTGIDYILQNKLHHYDWFNVCAAVHCSLFHGEYYTALSVVLLVFYFCCVFPLFPFFVLIIILDFLSLYPFWLDDLLTLQSFCRSL